MNEMCCDRCKGCYFWRNKRCRNKLNPFNEYCSSFIPKRAKHKVNRLTNQEMQRFSHLNLRKIV